jgi:hypothetical protein
VGLLAGIVLVLRRRGAMGDGVRLLVSPEFESARLPTRGMIPSRPRKNGEREIPRPPGPRSVMRRRNAAAPYCALRCGGP